MVDEGYLQNKIREQQERIVDLERSNTTFKIEIDSFKRLLNSMKEKKSENVEFIIKNIEKRITDNNKNILKTELLKLKETISNQMIKRLNKEFEKKTKDYDRICEKTMRVTSKLMDDYQDKQLKLNEAIYRINAIVNLLIAKELVTIREVQQSLNTYKKRKKKTIVE